MLLGCFPSPSQAGSPGLSILLPRGGQRGTEMDVSFHGARLGDAQEILFYEPGLTVLSMNTSNATELKVRLKAAPDARLGQHVVRVRTAGGITEARTLSIGQYPVIDEKEPNNDFASPQPIPLNTTVHGVAGTEDIDYFKVEAKKGMRLTVEVESMRLGSSLVDCHASILDLKRFELSASDDSAFALQDPVASALIAEDGVYVVAIRESSYAGNNDSRYRVHVGTAPRPLVAYPPGGRIDEETDIVFLGDVKGGHREKIKFAGNASGEVEHYVIQDGQTSPSPNRLRASPFANVLETEPNNSHAQTNTPVAELPVAFNGIIEKSGDTDFFRFKAKGGQKYEVRCLARSVQSPLDPVLALHKADGAKLAENDDSGGPDSLISWTVPADGDYWISVRDHLGKGGPLYVYRVEFVPPNPSLSLSIPEYARNSQQRNSIPVPKGNRFATLLRVNRANFGGNVILSAQNLPPGVSLMSDLIAGSVNETPVVFESAADAPLASRMATLSGAWTNSPGASGGFRQQIDLVYGEPNNTVYYKAVVDKATVAVTEEAPFKIRAVEPKVPLVQSGTMSLKIVADRKEGFKGPIKLSMLWNPPGIGSQNEVVIPEGQTEALYPLNASGDAAVQTWKIAILANADAGKGTVWTSSQLTSLTVSPPFLSLQIPMAAGEQGQSVAIVGKIQALQPFEGEARIELLGLPPKVDLTTNLLFITRTNQEISFASRIASDAPVGQHKTLFCQAVIMKDGEPIAHSLGGGGTLRIDAPPPPKPAAPAVAAASPTPAPAPVATPAAQAPPKPLSRLEKLRLEARERAQAQIKQ
ncbi:MAG: peptidase [Verrucomicrobia bacterium]|nr:peptidase [Verrucomicrobiota bacterium]